jgi:hypothetical protein
MIPLAPEPTLGGIALRFLKSEISNLQSTLVITHILIWDV